MARRGTAPVVEPTEVDNETVEEINSAETPVETEATVDATPAVEAIDLTDFKARLNEAFEVKDSSTGVIAEAPQSLVVTAYRALSTKGKTGARKLVEEAMKAAVNATDIVLARAAMQVKDVLVSSSGSTRTPVERTPADPTEAFVAIAVRLRLAMQIHSDSLDDTIDSRWKELTQNKVNELTPQIESWKIYLADESDEKVEPEGVDAIVKAAFKTAAGKAAGARKSSTPRESSGLRRDLAKHFAQAFADKEVGTFMSVNQIKDFKSDEYGDDEPSSGAISARLFPKDSATGSLKPTTLVGLEGAEENGVKGARKIA